MIKKQWALSTLLLLVPLHFQNCAKNDIATPSPSSGYDQTNSYDSNVDPFQFYSQGGNGDIYTGKSARYLLPDDRNQCEDGSIAKSEIRREEGFFLLVKEDCDYLPTKTIISDVTPISPEEIEYNGELYVVAELLNVRWATYISNYIPLFTKKTSITFDFEASEADEAINHWCRIDDQDWAECESGIQLNGLHDGVYSFSVKSLNEKGEVSLADRVQFTVDTAIPKVKIHPHRINTLKPYFDLTSSSDSLKHLTKLCRVKGGDWQECGNRFHVKAKAEGAHWVQVVVRDRALNQSEVQRFSWTNGGWSRWGSWSRCSRSCGGGKKRRYRSCTSPAPSGGGVPCAGSSKEVKSCNTKKCSK